MHEVGVVVCHHRGAVVTRRFVTLANTAVVGGNTVKLLTPYFHVRFPDRIGSGDAHDQNHGYAAVLLAMQLGAESPARWFAGGTTVAIGVVLLWRLIGKSFAVDRAVA